MSQQGAIIQILAHGQMNAYINQNATATCYRSVVVKCTPSSHVYDECTFNGGATFSSNENKIAKIQRSADLVKNVYCCFQVPGIANLASASLTEAQVDGLITNGTSALGAGNHDVLLEVVEDDESKTAYEQTEGCLAVVDKDKTARWCDNLGYHLMQHATIEIGSSEIETVYSEANHMYDILSGKSSVSLDVMIGRNQPTVASRTFREIVVPLPFWFSRDNGAWALPTVGLTFMDVHVKVKTDDLDKCVVNGFGINHGSAGSIEVVAAVPNGDAAVDGQVLTYVRKNEASVDDTRGTSHFRYGWKDVTGVCAKSVSAADQLNDGKIKMKITYDGVYLGAEERARFASGSQEYLVIQTQRNSKTAKPANTHRINSKLYYQHPVTELFWAIRRKGVAEKTDLSGHTDAVTGVKYSPLKHFTLKLNNNVRVDDSGDYFLYQEQYRSHSMKIRASDPVYTYCFSHDPESLSTTSNANFSRLDEVTAEYTFDENLGECEILEFAKAFNLIRMSEGVLTKVFA